MDYERTHKKWVRCIYPSRILLIANRVVFKKRKVVYYVRMTMPVPVWYSYVSCVTKDEKLILMLDYSEIIIQNKVELEVVFPFLCVHL